MNFHAWGHSNKIPYPKEFKSKIFEFGWFELVYQPFLVFWPAKSNKQVKCGTLSVALI
jgi:hypothetical protein